MVARLGVVIERRSNREKLSKAKLRFEVCVDEPEACSLLEALHDSLVRGEPGHGARTLAGFEADLRLYERLHRMVLSHAPELKLCDALQAQVGGGEFQRVIEAARQRWSV